jgi:protein TonB
MVGIICLLLFASPTLADDLEQSLKQAYQGKVFIIRNFWPGSLLRYDSAGQLKGDANPGAWTLDGLVRVEKIGTADTGVVLQCKRLVIVPSRDGFDFKDRRHAARLDILLDLDPKSSSLESMETAFSKIFVNDAGGFRDAVADSWRDCVSAALSGTEPPEHKGCHFGRRISALLSGAGSVLPAATTRKQEVGVILTPKIGGGVTAPKVISQADPQYPEEARLGKFEGTCVLSLVVNSAGEPKSISIGRPLGYGLDEQAVAAVETWRFEPSRKDGKPVSVKINVEVTFRMR